MIFKNLPETTLKRDKNHIQINQINSVGLIATVNLNLNQTSSSFINKYGNSVGV